MNNKKKLLSLVSAFAIAMPMSLVSVFANSTVDFTKISSTGDKLADAEVTFYLGGKKAFSFKTNQNGKVDPKTLSPANSYDVANLVDESGNLSLKAGGYTYEETKAPQGYMLNPKHESLSLVDGVSSKVELKNTKFKEDMGQIIVKSLDKSTGGFLGGATVDVKQGDKLLVTINFDSKGNVMDASHITDDGKNFGVEIVDGSISIKPGDYTLVENKASDGYALNTQEYKLTVKTGASSTIEIAQEKKTDSNETKEKPMGLKLRIINKSKSAVSGQEVSIYAVDKDKKNPKLLFKGKTGADGYLDSKKATEGKDLLKDSIVSLQPGNYYYQLTGGSRHNDFIVEQDKVNSIDKEIDNTPTSNSKKKKSTTSSSAKSASLAKTGVVGGLGPALVGGLAITSGLLISIKRKK